MLRLGNFLSGAKSYEFRGGSSNQEDKENQADEDQFYDSEDESEEDEGN